jgi:hypothetical protein
MMVREDHRFWRGRHALWHRKGLPTFCFSRLLRDRNNEVGNRQGFLDSSKAGQETNKQKQNIPLKTRDIFAQSSPMSEKTQELCVLHS